jgi:5-methylcytosine-specific restriction endonuclease McrA
MSRQVTPIPKKKTPKRGQSAASLKRKATTLHSMVVRARAGYACERCGTVDGQLQCAHIVSRRYTATRCDPFNAWCLCAACHRRLTEHPDEHVQFAYATRGEAGYAALRACAYAGRGQVMSAAFWRQQVDSLSAELTRLTR